MLLMVTMVMTVLIFMMVGVFYIMHKTIWEPKYLRINWDEAEAKFDRAEWSNEMCDEHFNGLDEIVRYNQRLNIVPKKIL